MDKVEFCRENRGKLERLFAQCCPSGHTTFNEWYDCMWQNILPYIESLSEATSVDNKTLYDMFSNMAQRISMKFAWAD
jgi:hypothetical protein